MQEANFNDQCDNVQHVALLIMRTPGGTHTGILYRVDGDLHALHQCWHLMFRFERIPKSYACVTPNLLSEEFDSVVGTCRLFVQRIQQRGCPRFPMAFSQPQRTKISAEGEVIWDGSVGLTCATFVLAVFGAAHIPLVDLSGWRRRPEDDARHEALLLDMERGLPDLNVSPADPSHIARVRAELPCIRVRPEEVAGAALFSDRPVGFELAEQAGLWILDHLRPTETR
jgi:hypothetical protein